MRETWKSVTAVDFNCILHEISEFISHILYKNLIISDRYCVVFRSCRPHKWQVKRDKFWDLMQDAPVMRYWLCGTYMLVASGREMSTAYTPVRSMARFTSLQSMWRVFWCKVQTCGECWWSSCCWRSLPASTTSSLSLCEFVIINIKARD